MFIIDVLMHTTRRMIDDECLFYRYLRFFVFIVPLVSLNYSYFAETESLALFDQQIVVISGSYPCLKM